jgi:two-component system, sensor histidine kinase
MAKPSDTEADWREQRDRIIGLGERSVHKNYYPLLRRNLTDLRKLLQAVEQATIGILICNRASTIEYVNPAFCAMTGDRPEDVIGHTPRQSLPEATPLNLWDGIERAVEAGEPWRGELLLRRKATGEDFWSQVSLTPVRDDAGAITHFVGMFSDITDRWKAAEQLRQAKEQLELRVEERTRELQAINSQLGVAKHQAEQANLSKTRFLAAASHDLLQPLNAARLFGSLLASRRLAPANRELVRNSLTALDTIDEILTALLDISKLDAGALPVTMADFAVADLFAGLAEQCGLLAERKGLRLTFAASSLWVRSDPRLLARILHNYVANAIRYTPTGGRALVGCRRRAGRVLLGVWDTGPGVPEDKLDEIFEEFRRLDGGTEQREKGIGLGLAIVQRMASLLDHPIVVRSTVGAGSLFGVELPRAAARPAAVGVRPAAPQSRTALSPLRGAEVVLIDDDSASLAGMQGLIGQWGCRTVAGVSGAAVLSQLAGRRQAPDLIVADYHLQQGHVGLSAITDLRTAFQADIPAVVVSADYREETRLLVQRAGCHFLAKPIQPAKLGSLMAQLLRRRTAE